MSIEELRRIVREWRDMLRGPDAAGGVVEDTLDEEGDALLEALGELERLRKSVAAPFDDDAEADR